MRKAIVLLLSLTLMISAASCSQKSDSADNRTSDHESTADATALTESTTSETIALTETATAETVRLNGQAEAVASHIEGLKKNLDGNIFVQMKNYVYLCKRNKLE